MSKKQTWYNKASVQASIVNAIPTILTAIIAIIAIRVATNDSNHQVKINQENFQRQIVRDSLLNISQDSTAELQFDLATLQLKIQQNQYDNDSINLNKQTDIFSKQLELLKKKSSEEDVRVDKGIDIISTSLVKYECTYSQDNVDSILGYKADFEYDLKDSRVKNSILLLHKLVYFNPVKDEELFFPYIFFTKSDAETHWNNQVESIKRERQGIFQLYKKYTFQCQLKNIGSYPITILKTSSSKAKFASDSAYRSNIATKQNFEVNRGNTFSGEVVAYLLSENDKKEEMEFNITIDYLTLHGQKHFMKKVTYFPPKHEIIHTN